MNDPSLYIGLISGTSRDGVDAALLMTSARAFLRMRASQSGHISEIINEMNRHLTLDVLDTGRFMTLFYLLIDISGRRLHWVRAGHDPALIYDPGRDEFTELKGSGVHQGDALHHSSSLLSHHGISASYGILSWTC